jgi:hypothetical protein
MIHCAGPELCLPFARLRETNCDSLLPALDGFTRLSGFEFALLHFVHRSFDFRSRLRTILPFGRFDRHIFKLYFDRFEVSETKSLYLSMFAHKLMPEQVNWTCSGSCAYLDLPQQSL